MPKPFTPADVQLLIEATSADEVTKMLEDHGYKVESEGGESDKATDDGGDGGSPPSASGDGPPSPPPFKSGVNPFEKRADVAKRAMKKHGMDDQQSDD